VARDRLRARAEKIRDPDWRESFLERWRRTRGRSSSRARGSRPTGA